ncbi:MAG: DNA alkylation repair protein [Anaerolineales bacterium]
MPPIDPARLRTRTDALAALFNDSARLAVALRNLLDDYADRTHRPSPRVVTSSVDNAYKTPGPVVRAIVTALRPPAQAQPEAALAGAALMWAGGSREERRIAAEVLGAVANRRPEQVLALIESWLPQIETGETADALAEFGLGPLIRAEPARYLEAAQGWVAHPKKWVRRFGLAALMPLVADKAWDNVPAALAIIRPVMRESDGEVRRAAAAALEGLGPKSPAEISRFLREYATHSNTNTSWIVRNALPGLGAAEQAEIIRVLRA